MYLYGYWALTFMVTSVELVDALRHTPRQRGQASQDILARAVLKAGFVRRQGKPPWEAKDLPESNSKLRSAAMSAWYDARACVEQAFHAADAQIINTEAGSPQGQAAFVCGLAALYMRQSMPGAEQTC